MITPQMLNPPITKESLSGLKDLESPQRGNRNSKVILIFSQSNNPPI